jgi:hypothetical protein
MHPSTGGAARSGGLGFMFYFILLLVLGVVGGGAFYAYKRVLSRPRSRF